jgi:protein-disulfide isomerase
VRTIAALIAVTVALPLALAAAQESPRFTINPAMARGPATAPVTIVEFSDYQ